MTDEAAVAARGRIGRNLPGPVAFAFGAGMARAAAQAGMLRAVSGAGVEPDIVVGSSWGAVAAAAVAVHRRDGVGRLEGFWSALAQDRAWTSRFRGVIRALTPRRSEASAEILREHLGELLGEAELDLTKPRACCVATDLVSGQAVARSTGSAVDAVLAAAAVPLLLPAVESGSQVLVDGGIVAPAPVRQAQALGAGSVVFFDVGASDMSVERASELKWYEVGIAAYADMLRSQTAADLIQVAKDVPVVVLSLPAGELLNFKDAPALVKRGEETGRAALEAMPEDMGEPGMYGVPDGMHADERLGPVACETNSSA